MKVFSKMKLKISLLLAIFCLNIFATIPWRHKMTIYLKYQLTNKLFKAVEDNNLEQVTYILDRYPEKINKIDSNNKNILIIFIIRSFIIHYIFFRYLSNLHGM